MKNILFLFLSLFLFGCGRDLSRINPLHSSPPNTISAPSSSWEDFEGSLVSPWGGSDIWSNTSNLIWNRSASVSHNGNYSLNFNIGIKPSATWGPWFGVSGSSKYPSIPANISGATTLEFWYMSEQATSFYFAWDEGTCNGADGEEWKYLINLPAASSWTKITIPLSSFISSGGNNIADTQCISYFWINWTTVPMVSFPTMNMYIDDITFF